MTSTHISNVDEVSNNLHSIPKTTEHTWQITFTQQTSITTSISSWFQCHLTPSIPKNTNGFQVINNLVTSVDGYFSLSHAEPLTFIITPTRLSSEKQQNSFDLFILNVHPNAVTWEAVKISIKEYFVSPNYNHQLRMNEHISGNKHLLRLSCPTYTTCNATRRNRGVTIGQQIYSWIKTWQTNGVLTETFEPLKKRVELRIPAAPSFIVDHSPPRSAFIKKAEGFLETALWLMWKWYYYISHTC